MPEPHHPAALPATTLEAISRLANHHHLDGASFTFRMGEQASLGLPGHPLELADRFDDLPLDERVRTISLDVLANAIDLRTLRRFVHRACRLLEVGGRAHLVLINPDRLTHRAPDTACWPGSRHLLDGRTVLFRPLRQLYELLRLFPTRPRTPIAIGDTLSPDYLWLSFERIADSAPISGGTTDEKYGEGSTYRSFDRLEEPEILDDWCYAAARLRPTRGETVLSLGSNDGRELEMFDDTVRRDARFIGIDLSESSIRAARARFPQPNFQFIHADLAHFAEIELPPADVVVALGVLQCTNVDRDALLRDLLPRLSENARLLVSIPNCHFGWEDILRRPLDRQDRRHDRSLVHKDLRFLSRHFYRHGFSRIESFGTYDAFLLVRR